jgi:cell fate (sporulation/competence/biofilm development) regulator YmcA (YheA/YmcA/DUF963 family)
MAGIYKLGNYDNTFGMSSPVIGSQSTGKTVVKNPVVKNSKHDDQELDDFVDDIVDAPQGKVNKKIVNSMAMSASDPYAHKTADRAAGQLRNTGGSNIFEFAGKHKNPIRKGISPYKQPKHSGGPIATGGSGQAFRTTGNYKRIGTQYGSSRPHKLLTDVEDEPVFNLEDIDEPLVKAFKKQQNEIKSIISYVKEYL